MSSKSESKNPVGTILLVDDNSLGLAARRSVLEELGHHVHTAGTAEEALDIYQKVRPDIVITDYKMPKVTGVELIARVRRKHPGAGIILISGFTDTLGLDEQNTGADVVIQKSNHEISHLVRAINRLLRKMFAQLPKEPAKHSTSTPQGAKRQA